MGNFDGSVFKVKLGKVANSHFLTQCYLDFHTPLFHVLFI